MFIRKPVYIFNALSYRYDSGQLLTRPDSFVLDTALTTYSLHYTTIIEQRSRLLTNISDSCISLYLNCLTLWILPTFSKWSQQKGVNFQASSQGQEELKTFENQVSHWASTEEVRFILVLTQSRFSQNCLLFYPKSAKIFSQHQPIIPSFKLRLV